MMVGEVIVQWRFSMLKIVQYKMNDPFRKIEYELSFGNIIKHRCHLRAFNSKEIIYDLVEKSGYIFSLNFDIKGNNYEDNDSIPF